MSSLTYPIFIFRSHVGFTAFAALVVGAMQVIVIKLVTGLDTGPILEVLMERLPAAFRFLITEQFLSALSLKGASAFALNHPLVLSLLAISAIGVPNRHISAENEDGTLELLLAHPFRRSSLLVSQWLSSAFLLFVMVLVGLIASLSAIATSNELTSELRMTLLKIATNLWLLFVLVMTITTMLATFAKAGHKVVLLSAGLLLVFYLFDVLSILWNKLEFIKPINIFTYFQPQKIMFGQRSFVLNAVVLIGAITVCLAISIRQFGRRDIPG
ncbi:ABC transporter permease [bacterium]|nr:ABC transporter permease [bacterium]